ncbi:MAG: prephenate dehydratase [Oscillospiraceae bacterium]|nr:prephenate dehydratase [Oscillospiraceae bacterium]
MSLQDLRKKIDEVDDALAALFEKRLDISTEIAAYKQQNNIPVFDPSRERQKLYDLSLKTGKGREAYITAFYSTLFDASRAEQERILNTACPLIGKIENAVQNSNKVFPERAVVACQGTEGAYSQLASEKLFTLPNIMYFNSFEGVFSAVNNGMCEYGVLPLENSTAGSINKVYDLMMLYPFSIVRSVRLKIDHCLLSKNKTELSAIKEVYSHEQAIAQCSDFIKSHGWEVKICENTAVSAKIVAESERNDIAALSSSNCAALYGLSRIADSVQDKGNNYTRFICISKDLAIYPGADKTSLMLTIPHKPGSLHHILSRLNIHGINLIKLESRPIPDRDFEFMFYFDLETPIYSPAIIQALRELNDFCDDFHYLGSYSEIL